MKVLLSAQLVDWEASIPGHCGCLLGQLWQTSETVFALFHRLPYEKSERFGPSSSLGLRRAVGRQLPSLQDACGFCSDRHLPQPLMRVRMVTQATTMRPSYMQKAMLGLQLGISIRTHPHWAS